MVELYSLQEDGGKSLSKNFKVREFACKDGSDRILIDNGLVFILQAVRSHFGFAVKINSGYRTESHNKKVNGGTYSYHLYGMAADIVVGGTTPQKVYDWLDQNFLELGGLGLYSWGVHIDTRLNKSRWKGDS